MLFRSGDVVANAGTYGVIFNLSDKKEFISIDAEYILKSEAYKLTLKTDSLMLSDFLPTLGMNELSVDMHVAGEGFDPFCRQTAIDLNLDINTFAYDSLLFNNINVKAALADSKYDISVISADSTSSINLSALGKLDKNKITSDILADIQNLNMSEFGISGFTEAVSSKFTVSASTDLKNDYNLDLDITELIFIDNNRKNNLGEIVLSADINSDSITLLTQSGDMKLDITIDAGLNALQKDISSFMPLVMGQIRKFTFNVDKIQKSLQIGRASCRERVLRLV